ncbi:unnamed protein product [Plutella xylostella]|uniref:(diamondback moth) hypothetical protein n=1 Tax=Plutella xylostella TaxID=51655 RepID=A0A8S4EX32_PLUXY|nr:unnamed protein product [Plutella xylostella]
MAGLTSILVVAALAVCAALPTPDPVLLRPSEQRFQYAQGPDGQLRLVDVWLKTSDVAASARYDPDRQNVYHLFTRQNPTVSQPLLLGSESLLELTHFSPARRTVVLLHGWLDDVLATFNSVLVPSFLQAADVNVIVVDWSAGANVVNYAAAVRNTVKSGESVAWFITWLNSVTGADSRSYHVVGHSLGAHQAGVIGRNVEGGIAYITVWFITWLNSVTGAASRSYHVVGHSLGAHQAGLIGRNVEGGIAYITAWFITWLNSVTGADSRSYHVVGHSLGAHHAGVIGRSVEGGIAYITALDPALPGWLTNSQRLRAEDAQYTEVIHTNAGLLGYAMPLGHTDFYPNGGVNMPGCGSQQCDHERSIHYFGESLTSSTFVGRRCASYLNAMTDNCLLPGRLAMGGLVAKTGSSGFYLLKTNAEPPFAQV